MAEPTCVQGKRRQMAPVVARCRASAVANWQASAGAKNGCSWLFMFYIIISNAAQTKGFGRGQTAPSTFPLFTRTHTHTHTHKLPAHQDLADAGVKSFISEIEGGMEGIFPTLQGVESTKVCRLQPATG